VAVPTDAGDICLLATGDLSPIHILQGGHSNIAGSARFRGEGIELLTGGFDERLILWDPRNGKRRSILECREILPPEEVAASNQIFNPPFILSLAVGSQQSLAIALGDGSLAAYPYEQGKPLRGEAPWKARGAHSAPADAVAWLEPASGGAKAAPTLVSAGRDCALHVWAVEAPRRQQTRRKNKGSAAVKDEEDDQGPKPLASIALREKPNALATASDGLVLVADVTSEVAIFKMRK